jgi:hypothetical protein
LIILIHPDNLEADLVTRIQRAIRVEADIELGGGWGRLAGYQQDNKC